MRQYQYTKNITSLQIIAKNKFKIIYYSIKLGFNKCNIVSFRHMELRMSKK